MSQKSILQKPIFWIAAVAVGAIGFTATKEDAVKPKAKVVKVSKPATKKGLETFTEEDTLASFDRVKVEFKNSFVPLVVKSGGLGGADAAANRIPASFSGGDANWVFTGTFEADGVREALLENRSMGDGVFLRRGQRWKNCIVKRVLEESVVLEGPSGEMTFGLVTEEKLGGRMASNSGGFSPVQVDNTQNFRGNIGGNGGGRNRGGGGLPGIGGGFSAVPQNSGGPPANMSTDDVPFAIPFGGQ